MLVVRRLLSYQKSIGLSDKMLSMEKFSHKKLILENDIEIWRSQVPFESGCAMRFAFIPLSFVNFSAPVSLLSYPFAAGWQWLRRQLVPWCLAPHTSRGYRVERLATGPSVGPEAPCLQPAPWREAIKRLLSIRRPAKSAGTDWKRVTWIGSNGSYKILDRVSTGRMIVMDSI